MAPVALVGGLGASGDERGRETEEGEGMQRVREKSEGTRGVVVALLGGPGKQEVAGAASALAIELLRCEGRKTTGGVSGGGLGRQLELGQVG